VQPKQETQKGENEKEGEIVEILEKAEKEKTEDTEDAEKEGERDIERREDQEKEKQEKEKQEREHGEKEANEKEKQARNNLKAKLRIRLTRLESYFKKSLKGKEKKKETKKKSALLNRLEAYLRKRKFESNKLDPSM